MAKRVTTADFVKRAREVHGDRYDYSKVAYVAAIKDVTIICREHGEFLQRPANHTTGHGCHECGGNKPLKLEQFIERANKIHDGRYDYSHVELGNVDTKVEIVCPDHGSFFQRPASHLKGFKCSKCGRVSTAGKLGHSIDRFLEDAERAHGDRYEYSEVEYFNALTNVTIICPDHGKFDQKPANHIRGVGCPVCGTERAAAMRVRSTEEFVFDARVVHGDRYEYSNVDYISSHEKVEIICEEHGSFWQLPPNHLKSGCPGCAVSGFDQTKPGLLYYVAVSTDEGDTRYKIGITNLSVEKRFPNEDLARIRIVKVWQFDVGHHAAEREAEILYQFAGDRYLGPDILAGAGNSELFTHDILGLDVKDNGQDLPTVDANANLTSRQNQRELDF